jgi:hypothetical protein
VRLQAAWRLIVNGERVWRTELRPWVVAVVKKPFRLRENGGKSVALGHDQADGQRDWPEISRRCQGFTLPCLQPGIEGLVNTRELLAEIVSMQKGLICGLKGVLSNGI